jgi:molybdopterin synthase sulfur carrier subunit
VPAAKARVAVRLFTSLRALTNIKETEVEAADIRELIDTLAGRFGDQFRQMLLESDGSLKTYFHVLVNGRHVRLLDGLSTRLNDGDVVAIFPPIGGG